MHFEEEFASRKYFPCLGVLFLLTLSVKHHCSFCLRLCTKGPLCDNARRPKSRLLYGSCQSRDSWHLYNITGVTAHGQDDRGEWKKVGQGSGQILNFNRHEESTGQIILRYVSSANRWAIMLECWKSPWSSLYRASFVEDAKGTAQENTKFHIVSLNPSKDSEEYVHVLKNRDLIHSNLFLFFYFCAMKRLLGQSLLFVIYTTIYVTFITACLKMCSVISKVYDLVASSSVVARYNQLNSLHLTLPFQTCSTTYSG